ncbi:MAG: putative manganese-dependent inorganic diphosphatase [Chloroflexota bacterium]
MNAITYVIGHKNPDTDAICAAIAYAGLRHRLGDTDVVPARQGDLWDQTRFVLERFGMPEPVLVRDVRLRVSDLMSSDPLVASPGDSLLQVGRLIREHNIRGVPILDQDRRPVGMVSVEDFARVFLDGLDPAILDNVPLELENVVQTLEGQILVAAGGRRLRNKVLVGAMRVESMAPRIEPDCLVVLGDREDAQRVAIECGAGALVVTGNLPVSPAILDLAQERNVTVISVPHHTFTTVRLLNMSTPVAHIMRSEYLACSPEDYVGDVRRSLSRERTMPVIDDRGCLVGILSRSDLLKPARRRLILVDHNERSQAVEGLEEAEIVGIIDHHRLADIQTPQPIFFRCEAVGCTCTIIAEMYEEAGVPIPPTMAGLMLSSIIADTLLFRSPTCTARDRRAAKALEAVDGVDAEALGHEIFAAGMDLLVKSPRELLLGDFKEFSFGEERFGVGSLEVTNRHAATALRSGLLEQMEGLRVDKGYSSVLMLLLYVLEEESELLIQGQEDLLAEAFGQKLIAGHSLVFPALLSRKKQVVPALAAISEKR